MDVWETIADERRVIADMADGLDAEQLATNSLCEGWTVRDVVAHVTVPLTVTFREVAGASLRSAGNLNKAIGGLTSTRAAKPLPELTALLRERAERHYTPPTLGPEAPLTDLLVHGLDMRRPLGLERQLPPEAVACALDFLVSKKGVRGFTKRGITKGLRFEADDLDWSWGDGETVTAESDDLLLALTGRRTELASLSGGGADELRGRLAGSR
jgi:uncharacterized protein (TIGR03083 family)